MELVGMDAVVVVLIIIVGLWLLSRAIKIVPEYQRIVVLRLGKSIGTRGPGFVLLIPFVDKPIWTDLREMVIDVPSQTCITKDNAPVAIDFLIYMKIIDPEMSVIQVQNFRMARKGSQRRRSVRSLAILCSTMCFPSANTSTKRSDRSSTKSLGVGV